MRRNATSLPGTMICASGSWSWKRKRHPHRSPEDLGETSPKLLAVQGRRAGKNLQGEPAIGDGGWDRKTLVTADEVQRRKVPGKQTAGVFGLGLDLDQGFIHAVVSQMCSPVRTGGDAG